MRPARTLFLILAQLLAQPVGGFSVAGAQNRAELDEARAKFQRAIELKQAGDFAGALSLFRAVGQVRMTPQVRYHIASCEEQMGKLVAALGGYELALAQGEDMPADFRLEVEAAISGLRQRIPKLIVERGEGAEAAQVQLDGETLGTAAIGQEIPLDPGPHNLSARSPGYEDFSTTVSADEGTVSTVSIDLVALPEPVRSGGEGGVGAPQPSGFGVTPYVVGGVGLALTVVGVVLLPVSQANVGRATSLCGGSTDCTGQPADVQAQVGAIISEAQTLETTGWLMMGFGLAAVGAGVGLYYFDPARRPSSQDVGKVRFELRAPRADVGFSLSGSF